MDHVEAVRKAGRHLHGPIDAAAPLLRLSNTTRHRAPCGRYAKMASIPERGGWPLDEAIMRLSDPDALARRLSARAAAATADAVAPWG